jgi:hypothetical protein
MSIEPSPVLAAIREDSPDSKPPPHSGLGSMTRRWPSCTRNWRLLRTRSEGSPRAGPGPSRLKFELGSTQGSIGISRTGFPIPIRIRRHRPVALGRRCRPFLALRAQRSTRRSPTYGAAGDRAARSTAWCDLAGPVDQGDPLETDTDSTARDQLVHRLAEVSHKTWMVQKSRDHGADYDSLPSEVSDHDIERAEDIVEELKRLGVLPDTF